MNKNKTTEENERNEWEHDPLTQRVIGAAMEVHRELGPGLLESSYEKCLCFELSRHGIEFKAQSPIDVYYKGINIDCGYRADILVENSLLLELKSVDTLTKLHQAQLQTYMKLLEISTGLLFNFNVILLKQGIKRISL